MRAFCRRKAHIFSLVLLALASAMAAARIAAQQPTADQGVLLLRNGQMIEGRITFSEDHYLVELPGEEIRLRAADVEFFCHSLEEGYERKRTAIQAGNAQDHLELAQWCERHGLYRSATAELADAAAIEPKHPMLGVLKRRLELATQQTPPAKPAAKAATMPTADDLDRMTRNMPPGTVEMFAQVVQPLLMNHCMASGCHGPQSENNFRLLRAPVNQPAGRRLTQRNLHAVLQYVNYADAQSSRLLTAVSKPHGPVKTPSSAITRQASISGCSIGRTCHASRRRRKFPPR